METRLATTASFEFESAAAGTLLNAARETFSISATATK
jgi:hypothetical protein